jgi:hypothetical protein
MRSTTTPRTQFVLAVSALSAGGCLNIGFALWAMITRPALNTDFRGPWSFARFSLHHAARIYQAPPLQAFQQRIYPGFHSFFPYQYPPSFLLAIHWLADFDFAQAELIWTFAGLVALTLAAALFFAPGRRWFAVAALLASPACLLNGAAGETGYFTAALLLSGFALLPARPWLAGIAFGLLTCKPQLALLIPVVLLASGAFRTAAAAGFTALALILLSCLLFPPELWLDWLRSLPVYQAEYFSAGRSLDLNNAVTIAGNVTALGASPRLVWLLQAAASLASAAGVVLVCRQDSYRLKVAAVFVGMFLATPHAFAYDTIPIVAATLLLGEESPAIFYLSLLTCLAPYLLLTRANNWFFYTIPETLLFIAIIYLAIRRMPRPNARYESVCFAKSRTGQF